MEKPDVLVLGAGIAGLSAALQLSEAGLRVLVIEAKNRIGGRIFTQLCGGVPIELGAEFVHGRPPELWHVIRRAGIDTYEVAGRDLWSDSELVRDLGDVAKYDMQWIEKLKNWTGEDRSFAEYLGEEKLPDHSRERLIQYVEGYNAADQQKLSVASLGLQRCAEEAIEGDRAFRLTGGYSGILNYFTKRLYLRRASVSLGVMAETIAWKRSRVIIRCRTLENRSMEFAADRAVVTLPLGVLKSGIVQFNPEPEVAFAAIRQLEMGRVCKVVLQFRDRFWSSLSGPRFHGSLNDLGFLHALSEIPEVWWSQFPRDSACLTAWSGGPKADQLAALLAVKGEGELIRILANIFGLPLTHLKDLLVRYGMYDWQSDPNTRGAYSYVPKNGLQAVRKLTEPIDDTLFFAGEHTDSTGHWGTVHGALLSGIRAASQILKTEGRVF